MENSSTSPEIVIRDGEPVAVILSIAEYRELLEKAEDLEALRYLEKMRKEPLELRRLSFASAIDATCIGDKVGLEGNRAVKIRA